MYVHARRESEGGLMVANAQRLRALVHSQIVGDETRVEAVTLQLYKLFDVGVVVDRYTDFKGSAEGVDVFHQG